MSAPGAPGGVWAPVPAHGERLYFLHVQKTAGITVRHVLASWYPRREVCPAQEWAEILALDPARLVGYRLFAGHFGARFPRWFPQPVQVLTMLREPVSRVLSRYVQIRREPGPVLHRIATRDAPTLEAFLDHPAGQAVARNRQTAVLALDEVPEVLAAYWAEGPRRVGAPDLRPAVMPPDDELLARALARLESCAWVGVVERFDESMQLLADAVQMPPVGRIPVRNASRAAERPEVSVGVRARLEELNQLDRVVYERACALVAQRYAGLVVAARDAWCAEVLAARSTGLCGSVTVGFGDPFWGEGWWPRESSPVGPVRWSGPGTVAWVDVPVRVAEGAVVEVLVHAALEEAFVAGLGLEVNGVALAVSRVADPGGVRCWGVVPAAAAGPWTRVVVRTPGTTPWDALHPESTETGRRGVAVAWIRLHDPDTATTVLP